MRCAENEPSHPVRAEQHEHAPLYDRAFPTLRGAISPLARGLAVSEVVDVRRIPFSRRNPQFNRDRLTADLRQHGIGYCHLGSGRIARSGRGGALPPHCLAKSVLQELRGLCADETVSRCVAHTLARRRATRLRHHVRGRRLAAMPPPDHLRLSDPAEIRGTAHSSRRLQRARTLFAVRIGRAGWNAALC